MANKFTLARLNAIVCLYDRENEKGHSSNEWYDTPWTREVCAVKEVYMSPKSHPSRYLVFAPRQPGLTVCIHLVTQLAKTEVLHNNHVQYSFKFSEIFLVSNTIAI